MEHFPDAKEYHIRAAVLRKRGEPLEIETLVMEGPRKDEVLVRIVATGICHTDIGICDEWDDAETPVVLGHEGAGVVEEVCRGVEHVTEGDAVPQVFIPKLIRLYQAGEFPFDRLEKFYPFKDINRAIADAKRGVAIKPVLRTSKA